MDYRCAPSFLAIHQFLCWIYFLLEFPPLYGTFGINLLPLPRMLLSVEIPEWWSQPQQPWPPSVAGVSTCENLECAELVSPTGWRQSSGVDEVHLWHFPVLFPQECKPTFVVCLSFQAVFLCLFNSHDKQKWDVMATTLTGVERESLVSWQSVEETMFWFAIAKASAFCLTQHYLYRLCKQPFQSSGELYTLGLIKGNGVCTSCPYPLNTWRLDRQLMDCVGWIIDAW
jgi:hypothetical protein